MGLVQHSQSRAGAGRDGWRGGTALVSFALWDVRGNPVLWAGMRLSPPAARAETSKGFLIHLLDAVLFTARKAQRDGNKSSDKLTSAQPSCPSEMAMGETAAAQLWEGRCTEWRRWHHGMEEMALWHQGDGTMPSGW